MNNFAKFGHAKEKFVGARRILMLPSPNHEFQLITYAITECLEGLHNINLDDLDVDTRNSVISIKELINRLAKSKRISRKQKNELCDLVDELASWFIIKFNE